jgi:hypothetical protein
VKGVDMVFNHTISEFTKCHVTAFHPMNVFKLNHVIKPVICPGQFFVYHTCKNGRITYKYVINPFVSLSILPYSYRNTIAWWVKTSIVLFLSVFFNSSLCVINKNLTELIRQVYIRSLEHYFLSHLRWIIN